MVLWLGLCWFYSWNISGIMVGATVVLWLGHCIAVALWLGQWWYYSWDSGVIMTG